MSKLSCFLEGIGVCEQLIGIPIPLSYTRLTSRFLVLWHLTLPVILWNECKWIVVPATFISAASLFCIEEVSFYTTFMPPCKSCLHPKPYEIRLVDIWVDLAICIYLGCGLIFLSRVYHQSSEIQCQTSVGHFKLQAHESLACFTTLTNARTF